MVDKIKKISDIQAIDFLKTEYTECFGQIKHYENIADSYLKFVTGGYPAVIGGISALYTILNVDYRNLIASALLLLTFIAGFAVLTILLTNRSYYVVVTRQINAIRRYFLENTDKIDFIDYNRAYIDPDQPPAYNSTSTSSWLFIIVAILNSLVGAGFLFFILYHFKLNANVIWSVSAVSWVLFSIVQGYWGIWYLKKKDAKHIAQTKK